MTENVKQRAVGRPVKTGIRVPVLINAAVASANSCLKYQCFLTGENNRAPLTGNTADDSGIWQLYKRAITESENIVSAGRRNKDFT